MGTLEVNIQFSSRIHTPPSSVLLGQKTRKLGKSENFLP